MPKPIRSCIFTSHGDPALALAVSEGRWKEFEEFTEATAFFDPQAAEAFERSKLTWDLLHQPQLTMELGIHYLDSAPALP